MQQPPPQAQREGNAENSFKVNGKTRNKARLLRRGGNLWSPELTDVEKAADAGNLL